MGGVRMYRGHSVINIRFRKRTPLHILCLKYCSIAKRWARTAFPYSEKQTALLRQWAACAKQTRVLISPSSLRRLENNHSLPSNILSIRQSSSSHPYTRVRRSHCRERWGVNRMGYLPPPPHLHPQFSHMYSSRQVQFNMLYEARTVGMYVPEVEPMCSYQMHPQHLQEYIESFRTIHIFRFSFLSLTRVGD